MSYNGKKKRDQLMGLRLTDNEYEYIKKCYGSIRYLFDRVILEDEEPHDFTPFKDDNRRPKRKREESLYDAPKMKKKKIRLPPIS